MSSYCATEKKPDYVDLSGVYPIKEFSRFSETANKIYNTFSSQIVAGNSKTTVDVMYENVNILNGIFNNKIPNWDLKAATTPFPYIRKKIEMSTVISLLEVDGLINESVVLTPTNLIQYVYTPDGRISKDIVVVLISYEDYLRTGGYTKDSMGSFCSLVPNIFAGIEEFSNFFDNIKAIAKDIINKINSIKNFSAKQLLQQLQNMIIDTANKIFESNLKKIMDFKFGGTALASTVSNSVNNRVLERGLNIKNEIEQLFSKNNFERIKENIEGLIAYAVGIFERKDIEEIEFLVYRFCGLIQNLEQDSGSQLSRMKSYASEYDDIVKTVSASSNIATSRATQAGARRTSGSDYTDRVKTERGSAESKAEAKGVGSPRPISSGDTDGITPWNDGKGDSRLRFQGGWVPALGREGWDRVDMRAKVGLMRLQAKLGIQLILNSGYRSPAYNAGLAKRTKGVAKNSYHMRGEACDITWDGFRGASVTEKRNFIKAAASEGFNGFGGYNGFIHIDIGPSRSWGIRY